MKRTIVFLLLLTLLSACSLPQAPAPTVTSPLPTQPVPTATTELPTEVPTDGAQPTNFPPKNAPTPTLPPLATPSGALLSVDYQGVSFIFDPALASGANGLVIPEQSGGDTPAWAIVPETVQFDFTGYVLSGTFHQPQIFVYPLEDYIRLNENIAGMIDQLKQILADQPDGTALESIPSLPGMGAAQFYQANVRYLRFQNGSGVRFLTQYGQAAWPTNNLDLFYSFQGITDDGKYYIAIKLPVNHPDLPATGEAGMPADYTAFSNTFDQYLANMEVQLSGYSADSFTPNLTLLDSLVQSINITK
jgi:hypothetical protein